MSQLSRRTFLALAAMASRGWAQPKQTTVVLLLTGVREFVSGACSCVRLKALK
jgi:hypothetical protein